MKASLLASLALALALSSAAAADKIKVLIVDGQNNHNWKMTTPVLQQILEQPGIFSVEVSTSPEKGKGIETWHPKFSDYAVVVSNYNGEPWSAATQEAFEKYVSGGGGFVSVHAADNAFPEWKAYNEMIGVGGWGASSSRRSISESPPGFSASLLSARMKARFWFAVRCFSTMTGASVRPGLRRASTRACPAICPPLDRPDRGC